MTCIVGVIEKKKVWMGADALASSWSSIRTIARPKVFIKGKFIFGFAGSLAVGQALEYNFKPPPNPRGMETRQYIVTKFIPSLKKSLKSVGLSHVHNGIDSIGEYSLFMVGYKGRLFTVCNDYGAVESKEAYACIGIGTNTANGSLHTSNLVDADNFNDELGPHRRIEMALSASEEHNPGVRGPFTILSK